MSPSSSSRGAPMRWPLSASIALVVVLAACASAAPGSSATSSSPAGSASAGPSVASDASRRPATPRPSPTPTPIPAPVVAAIDGVSVSTLTIGSNAAPIDVEFAFGSVWVANHHASTVTRIDPKTMTVQATIKTGSGPGWLVATKDAVWVSNQNGVGLTRVDPGTNTAETTSGDAAPCGQGVFARGSVWQPACDSHRILRVDATTFVSTDIVSAAQSSIVRAGQRLITGGSVGLAELDPKTNTFRPIGGPDTGWLLAFDGSTIWSSDERQVLRLRPADGSVVATLAIPEAGTVELVHGRAWVTSSTGLMEVDPATNAIVRTVPIGRSVAVVDGGGALWVTSYDANTVTRLRL